jgi:hypothetical protein
MNNSVILNSYKYNCVRFEVLTAAKMAMLWVVTPCRLVTRCQRFEETYFLHFRAEGRWRGYVYLKRWYLPTSLHGVTTQNNIVIISCILVFI